MLAQAKIIIDYLGGPDILWLVLVSMAGTQFIKIALASLGHREPMLVRPLPYAIGALASSYFLDRSVHAALIGMVCGMIASGAFAGAIFYLRKYKFDAVADFLTLAEKSP